MRFSTDFRFGSFREPREAEVQESSLALEELGEAGFLLRVAELEARALKGETMSNMVDLRRDGGAGCWGWDTGTGWGGEGRSRGGSWGRRCQRGRGPVGAAGWVQLREGEGQCGLRGTRSSLIWVRYLP